MACIDVRRNLDCSVCLTIYTDPVTLSCGHNFCRVCIDRALDTQGGPGGYFCPECRTKFHERPALKRNIALHNISENARAAEPAPETRTSCTYCIHAAVPAVTSCLHCEASLCDDHLQVHRKSSPHVLSDLSSPTENRKCSIHKKNLEYYCTEDSACLCGPCRVHGEHQEHEVETLEEASEKRKDSLSDAMQKLLKRKEMMEQLIDSLRKYKIKTQESAASVTKRVNALFRDIRRQLDTLERRVLKEISLEAEKVSFPVSDFIQELAIKKDELSKKMHRIEELCTLTDPLTFLQESDKDSVCETEDGDDDREIHDKLVQGGGDLDVTGISHTLYTGLSDIITGVNKGIYIPEPDDILLDIDTANVFLDISDDRKFAHAVKRRFYREHIPQRFNHYSQVMSSQSFTSGRHYFDVDVRGSSYWRVGMCHPCITRTEVASELGNNWMSWCLERRDQCLSIRHYSSLTNICNITSIHRVRVYVDYKGGQISFYELSIPIRHLHTFTDTFTEPLNAAFLVGKGCIRIG